MPELQVHFSTPKSRSSNWHICEFMHIQICNHAFKYLPGNDKQIFKVVMLLLEIPAEDGLLGGADGVPQCSHEVLHNIHL